MNFVESFRIALRALNANKVRSALTMLGVIIGVAAVILLVAIGSGVQRDITGSIEGLGSNLLFALPGDFSEGGGPGGGGADIRKRFKMEDAETLRRRLPAGTVVVPVIQGQATLKYGNRTFRASVTGGNDQGDQVFNSTYNTGRHYNRGEYVSGERVLVLGDGPRQELFGGQNAVGRELTVNGQRFKVIGSIEAQGGSLTGDQDNAVYMPATTAQRLFGTSDLSSIILKAPEAEDVKAMKPQIEKILRPRFGDEFTVFTQEETLGLLTQILGTLTVMLAGIAGISLLVGGIGIMNIMLVSVSERTREIGIRKAVGARTYDIMSQFVIEAVVLSVTGGLVGIAIGWLGALALQSVVPTEITWWAVVIAFFFSAAVGVFFGVYPAWRASRLDPITALRYE
ncbi:MAG: ABC transporter permease [Coriobacteriales bacterium]|nr:ABC transporter permease [Coriobacteriales bacterium]